VIITSRTMEDIKKVLAKDHFVRLEQSGYQLVADGLVSLDEIDAAVGK
jgi:type II secretory ATPase GspE/PulE/Tfp pilus assembly ATPase PilB-like protein